MSASAASSKPEQELHGTDIAQLLKSSGPIVKAVLLQHMRADGKDTKPHPPPSPKADEVVHKRPVLTELIQEVEIDTTPAKDQVKQVLGGPFTFIGQYPSEETVVMARRELPDDLETLPISKLRELCADSKIDTSSMIEKQEFITALTNTVLPVNPHKLQPPLNNIVVRGDILIMKVADETEEVVDEEEVKEGAQEEEKKVKVLSNEEFFLDYTKEEYVAFASRTDVVAPERPHVESEEEESEGEEEEEEDDYELGEDEDVEEEERKLMLNMIMGEVLKKFRDDNGRGPNTHELLELRSQVAQKLGVEVASVEFIEEQEIEQTKKRAASVGDESSVSSTKKVKFDAETKVANGDGPEEDKKIAAAGGEKTGETKDS